MKPKYGNSSDGFRSSFGRHRSRGDGGGAGGYSRSYSRTYKNTEISDRKMDILMEAGRLAAEYLVAKGMLPPDSLPAKSSEDGNDIRGFRGQGRDNEDNIRGFRGHGRDYEDDIRGFRGHGRDNEGRGLGAMQRGDSGFEAGYRKRRFDNDDDYDRPECRMIGRERRRRGYYDRDREHSLDRDRERGRNGLRRERNRGYSDRVEDEDDLAPDYRRKCQSGFNKLRSTVSRVSRDKHDSKIGVGGESGSELDDAKSKVSLNNCKKDAALEADADFRKEMVGTKVMNVEGGEVEEGESSDFENKTMTLVEENFSSTYVGNGDESANNNQSYDFTDVSRHRHSSLAHKGSPVDKGPIAEDSNKVEGVLGGEVEMTAVIASTEDSPAVQGDMASHVVPANNSGSVAINSNNETPDLQPELGQDVQYLEPSMTTIYCEKGAGDKNPEKVAKSSPAWTSQENELSLLGSAVPIETNMFAGMPSQDAGIPETGTVKDVDMEPVGLSKPDLASKDEANSFARIQQEKCNLSASFKLCDLNLMEAPGITEIPDDTDAAYISASSLEAGNELSGCFGPSAVSEAKNTSEHYCPSDEKFVPVNNLEEDFPTKVNAACETDKPKKEIGYQSLENELNQATNACDLQVVQENSIFAISECLEGDISSSPSVQADHHIQAGMGLPGPEGSPGVEMQYMDG